MAFLGGDSIYLFGYSCVSAAVLSLMPAGLLGVGLVKCFQVILVGNNPEFYGLMLCFWSLKFID